jgi:adenosine deaminase
MGPSVIVVADRDTALAERTANELGDWVWSRRETWYREPPTVREALEFGATRIGHGVHVVEDPAVLAEAVRRGATFEMCLTSNVMTRSVGRIADHPFARFLREGVKVTLNPDDPGVQGSTLTQDFERAESELGLGKPELKRAVLHAVDAAFVAGSTRAALRATVEEGWR